MVNKLLSHVMPTYGNKTLEFVKGKGCYLYSTQNKKYLDFASGIAVNSLGHCHSKLIEALNKQSKQLWHVSNLYKIKKQEQLAKFCQTLCPLMVIKLLNLQKVKDVICTLAKIKNI